MGKDKFTASDSNMKNDVERASASNIEEDKASASDIDEDTNKASASNIMDGGYYDTDDGKCKGGAMKFCFWSWAVK